MNDDQFFLANAYLDGELTDDERRIAAADPAVMSEVEKLRALQDQLRAVPPPTDTVRNAAIGAALAEFGVAAPAGDDRTEPVAAAPFRSRRTAARYLAVAAALVAVAGMGIVVSRAGGDDDDASDAVSVVDDRLTESAVAGDGGGDDAMDADDAEAGAEDTAAMALEAAPVEESTFETADEAANEVADDAGAATAADGAAGADMAADEALAPALTLPADFDPDTVLDDIGDLSAIGIYVLGERDAERLPPSPNTVCSGAYEALRRSELDDEGRRRAVLIAIDDARGVVYAIDERTCAIVLEAPLR